MIPVSTLVSGIDNGPVHLGPLKLAWHFKGGRTGSRGSQLRRRERAEAGGEMGWGVGGLEGWRVAFGGVWVGGKVFLACDETEYVLGGADLEHRGILYKYGAYGVESL